MIALQHVGPSMNKIAIGLAALVNILLLGVVHAETVTLQVNEKITAEAEFYSGNPKKPAVLLLHGFITTNQFPTVLTVANAIADNDITVLTPNLTLGINKREQSVKCQSVHTHTLEEDIQEVKMWHDWLLEKGYKDTIFIGHSTGSSELVSTVNAPQFEGIKLTIFSSLFYLSGADLGTQKSDLIKAQKRLESGDTSPTSYSFLFCHNNYNATAKSFLSYQIVTRQFIMNHLNQTQKPTYVIMGGQDKRYKKVGKSWLTEIDRSPANLVVI